MEKTIAECHPDIIAFNCCRSAEVTFNGKPPSNYGLNPGFYAGESFCLIKEATCSGLFNSLATKIIKRSLFDLQVDYSIWKGLMHGEDFIQVLPVVDAAQSLIYLNETLYFYREHLQSSTRSFNARQVHDLDLVFARLFPYAQSWDGDCVKNAEQAVCRHAVWLLFNLAHTQDNKKKKEEDARQIAHLVTKYCSNDLQQTISTLRIEMRILLTLLLKGSFNAAFLLARIVFKLSEIINH